MKKLFAVFALLIALSIPALAALDTYTLTSHASVLPATAITNAAVLTTVTGDAFDLMPYKGFATITVSHGPAFAGETNRISILSIQQTNTVAGGWAVYRAITNSTASASFTRVPFEVGKGGRYIRGVYTSTNGTTAVSSSLNAFQ